MIRTQRIIFRKNWALSPNDWNMLWHSLRLDMDDLWAEMENFHINYAQLIEKDNNVIETIRSDKRVLL